jgi:hypothetical protein
VWLRLRLLLPLLPTVRADRERDSKKNLRVCLAQTLPHLLVSPYLLGNPATAAAGSSAADDMALVAAAAAAEAGHPLFDRLLLMLSALLSGDWAGWLRGSNSKLRQVAVPAALAAACRAEIEGALQLPQAADATWMQQQLVVATSGALAHAANTAAADCASGSDLHAVEALVHELWQQQQQQHAEQHQQQRKLPLQGLASRYKQRALAALPLLGPQQLQLPSMLSAEMPQQHAGSDGEHVAVEGAGVVGRQQQQAVPYAWDMWQPVCPLRLDTAAASAAASAVGGVAVDGRHATTATPHGAGSSSSQPIGLASPRKRQLQQQQQSRAGAATAVGCMARTSDVGGGSTDGGSAAASAAAACLLQGCVRRRRVALLYAGPQGEEQ